MDPKRTARFLVDKASELLREVALIGPHCGLGEGVEDLQCSINDALVATQEAKGYLVAETSTPEDKRADAYLAGAKRGYMDAVKEAMAVAPSESYLKLCWMKKAAESDV